MAGILGIVDPEKRGNWSGLLDRMCLSLKHEDWYQVDSLSDPLRGVALGRVHLGLLNPQPQPIFNEDRTLGIVMEGELFACEEAKSDLMAKGHIFAIGNDPEFVLHLYEERGNDFAKLLNGSFALAIWDAPREKLLVAGDRYCSRPIYWAEVGGRFLFASEVKAILQDPKLKRRIDDLAVSQLFAFSHLLGDETMFQGVSALPPASLWVFSKGHLSRKKYWSPAEYHQASPGSEMEYLEEINHRFRQAVQRRVNGGLRIGVPLTGGTDSRMIMAVIDHEKAPVFSFTFGISGATDMDLAPKVAQASSRNHHLYWLQPDFLTKHANEVVHLTDGMLSISHAHGLPAMRAVRDHADALLSGIAGEYCKGGLSRHHILTAGSEQELISAGTAEFLRIQRALPETELQRLFSPSYYQRIKGLAQRSAEEELSKTANIGSASVRLDHFYASTRSRRFATMGLVFIGSQLEHRSPFLDNDYLDIVIESPLTLRTVRHWNKIHAWVIGKNNPALARLPSDKTMIRLDASPFLLDANRWFRMGCKAINKVAKTNLRKPRFYTDYGRWMRKELRSFVEGILLDARTLGRGYYNGAHVREMVNAHMAGKADLHQELCTLMTFELFHRQFLD